MLSQLHPTRRLWLFSALLGLALVVAAGAVLWAGQRSSSPSTQPKITWPESQIEVILSPGESAIRDLTFTSSLLLTNVVLEAVPDIAGFVSLQPSNVANLAAGQPQPVQLSFSIPAGSILGTYEGTVHLRVGHRTLPQTLKVSVHVWQQVSDSAIGTTVYIPPSWSFTTDDGAVRLSSPDMAVLTRNQDAEVPPAEITIRPLPNESHIPLATFVDALDNGWFDTYLKKTSMTVDGHPAIRYSDIGAALPHKTVLATFIEDDGRVVVVTSEPLGDVMQAEVLFDSIVSTIRLN